MTRSVVVAAHPDDEILWLSAALARARPVVLCFGAPFGRPEKAAARRRAVAELGLAHLADLALPESGVRKLVDWSHPDLTPTGMAIADASGQARYDANFTRLLADLRPLLAGASDVYTHNAWGEYGHPEHVQVHRAVTALQAELRFTLWFSNYVGPASWGLALRLGAAPCWAEKRDLDLVAPPSVARAGDALCSTSLRRSHYLAQLARRDPVGCLGPALVAAPGGSASAPALAPDHLGFRPGTPEQPGIGEAGGGQHERDMRQRRLRPAE